MSGNLFSHEKLPGGGKKSQLIQNTSFYEKPRLRGKEKKMNTKTNPESEKTIACETCTMRKKAEDNPKSLMSRIWRWHTGWCPGWKAYQTHLAEQVKQQA
jgi:hypothetical protein